MLCVDAAPEVHWDSQKNKLERGSPWLDKCPTRHVITSYVLSGPVLASSVWGVCVFGGSAARRPICEQWEADRQQSRINTHLIGPVGGGAAHRQQRG